MHVALHDPNNYSTCIVLLFIQEDYDEDELTFDLIAVDVTTIS